MLRCFVAVGALVGLMAGCATHKPIMVMVRDAGTHQPVTGAHVRIRVEAGEIPAWMEGPTYATDPEDAVGQTDADGVFLAEVSPEEPFVVMVWLGWIPQGAVRFQSLNELGDWQGLPGPISGRPSVPLEVLVRPKD